MVRVRIGCRYVAQQVLLNLPNNTRTKQNWSQTRKNKRHSEYAHQVFRYMTTQLQYRYTGYFLEKSEIWNRSLKYRYLFGERVKPSWNNPKRCAPPEKNMKTDILENCQDNCFWARARYGSACFNQIDTPYYSLHKFSNITQITINWTLFSNKNTEKYIIRSKWFNTTLNI